MANEPLQLPNIELPGLEFFPLAPGRTVSIDRRVVATGSQTINILPNTSAQFFFLDVLLDSQWGHSRAFYLHDAWLLFNVADSAGQVTVLGARMYLWDASAAVPYDIGFPSATTGLTPRGNAVVLSRATPALITREDLRTLNANAAPVGALTLKLHAEVTANNVDPVLSHTATVTTVVIGRLLEGVLT
jgi:hypothetical protein